MIFYLSYWVEKYLQQWAVIRADNKEIAIDIFIESTLKEHSKLTVIQREKISVKEILKDNNSIYTNYNYFG